LSESAAGSTGIRTGLAALLLLAWAAGSLGCAGHEGAAGDAAPRPDSPQAQVEAALGRYAALVLAMDHAGIAAMFAAEGAIVNDGQPPIRGPVKIRAFLESFSGYKVLANDMETSRTVVEGETAVQEGTYHQRVRTPEGKVLEVSGRFEVRWARSGPGEWLIEQMGTQPLR